MRWWIAIGMASVIVGCGEVKGEDADRADATVADAPPPLASCKALHEARPSLPSGTYEIDPDGPGGDQPVNVTCDMMTDGGGWTIVFLALSNNLVPPISYTGGTPRLMLEAQSALMAYRHATGESYTNYVRFELPMEWRTTTPFSVASKDLTLTAMSVNGGAVEMGTIRYGFNTFTAKCNDSWIAGSVGRICIPGKPVPYFSNFASSQSDYCADSTDPINNTTPCSDDRRFSIAVR